MVLMLFHDVDLLVWTLLVNLHNMLLSLDQELITDIFHISGGGSLLDFVSNNWVFNKDFVLKELLV